MDKEPRYGRTFEMQAEAERKALQNRIQPTRLGDRVNEKELTLPQRIARAHGLPLEPLLEEPRQADGPSHHTTEVVHVKRQRRAINRTRERRGSIIWRDGAYWVE